MNELNSRFITIGDPQLVMKPINPVVSFAPNGCRTKNYANSHKAELKPTPLYDIMKKCASGDWEKLEKGAVSMHVYDSRCKGLKPYKFNGAIFCDLDGFKKYRELDGYQDIIFDNFEKLCQAMPNLLCVKFSPSKNLHFCLYHKDIKSEQEFTRLSKMYMCMLCRVIKNVIGIDLRDFDGVIDTHNCNPNQQLNLNDSPVKWNVMCSPVTISKDQLNRLTSEYKEYMKEDTLRKVTGLESTILTQMNVDGETIVNNQFTICGYSGFQARTAICAAAYFHFKQDVNKTREFLYKKYKNADEMEKQLLNMVQNNTIGHKYESSVEKMLFNDNWIETIIPRGKYLSDVICFESFKSGKFYYIVAGTGIGKTEFVKNLAKMEEGKIIILQMNKALRDGKKQGIEDFTYDNFKWDGVISKDKIHTTIEGFIRNCYDLNLEEYIVVVDEAHLLQDYVAINGKRDSIISLLDILPEAKQVIFMSATPKIETKLFPFEVRKFTKIKNQTLNIVCHPLKYAGRGSKEAARYGSMIDIIKKIKNTKHIIFSNKCQECWKKYGLVNEDYTWFHSLNIKDEKVQSILNDNKLLTDFTLATCYLGVGVEIKGEKDIHLHFDLNEGWDINFIEQSIGRPRDAENIYVHLYYTEDAAKRNGFDESVLDAIKNAFRLLFIEIDDELTINLYAAKITGISDLNFMNCSCKDMIELLKLGQIKDSYDHFQIYDIDLLKKLPYKNIKIQIMETITLNTDGKNRINREEIMLKENLISRSDMWWASKKGVPHEDVLPELRSYWNDLTNARNLLKECKYIWNQGFDLNEVDRFFNGNINLAYDVIHDLNDYCSVKAGKDILKSFDGSERVEDKIELKFMRVENAFNQEFLDQRVDYILLNKPFRIHEIEFDHALDEFLGLVDDETEKPKRINPFKINNWKEGLKELRNETLKVNGKNNPKQSIKIKNNVTNEVKEFDSKNECMKFLNVSKQIFYKFIKGESIKKLKEWNVIECNEMI